MAKYLIFFLLSGSYVFSRGADSLTGVWQDAEAVGAGWSNTFLFFGDGTFNFFYSQMDHRKHETGYSGSFKLVEDGLNLYVNRRHYLEGGHLERDLTGGDSDSVLVDAASKTLLFDPPELVEMSISKIYSDTEYAMGKYIYLDAIKFFLMSKDPAGLLHEFEGK